MAPLYHNGHAMVTREWTFCAKGLNVRFGYMYFPYSLKESHLGEAGPAPV